MKTDKFDEEYATLASALRDGFRQFEDLKTRIEQADKAPESEGASEYSDTVEREELLARYKALKREIHEAQVAIRSRCAQLRRDIKDHEEKLQELKDSRNAGELTAGDFDELAVRPSAMIEMKMLHIERLKSLVTTKRSKDIFPVTCGETTRRSSKRRTPADRFTGLLRTAINVLSAAAALLFIAALFLPFLSPEIAAGTSLLNILNETPGWLPGKIPVWSAVILAALLNLALCLIKASKSRDVLHFMLFEAFLVLLVWTAKDASEVIDNTVIGGIEVSTFGIGAWFLGIGLLALLLSGLLLMLRSLKLASSAVALLLVTAVVSAGYLMNWFGLIGAVPKITLQVKETEMSGIQGRILEATISNNGGQPMRIHDEAESQVGKDDFVLIFEAFDEESKQWKGESTDEWRRRIEDLLFFPLTIEPGGSLAFQRIFSPIWGKEPGEELTADSEAGKYQLVIENSTGRKSYKVQFEIPSIEHPAMKTRRQVSAARDLCDRRDYQGALALLDSVPEGDAQSPLWIDIQQLKRQCRDMIGRLARQAEGNRMLARAAELIQQGALTEAKPLLQEVGAAFDGLSIADEARDLLSDVLDTEALTLFRDATELEEQGAEAEALAQYQRIVQTYQDAPTSPKAQERLEALETRVDERLAAKKLLEANQLFEKNSAASARLLLQEIEEKYPYTSSYPEAHRLASIERYKEEFLQLYKCSGFITTNERAGVIVRELYDKKRLFQAPVGECFGTYVVRKIDEKRRVVIFEREDIEFAVNVQ